jgi:hypothetical protein
MTLKIDVARQQMMNATFENWTAQEVQDLFRLVEKYARTLSREKRPATCRALERITDGFPPSSPGQMRQALQASAGLSTFFSIILTIAEPEIAPAAPASIAAVT